MSRPDGAETPAAASSSDSPAIDDDMAADDDPTAADAPAPGANAAATGTTPIRTTRTPAPATATPPTGEHDPARPAIGWWALALLLTLGAAWLLLRRNQRLAADAQRMARQQRALRSVNSRLQSESATLREQAINDPLTGALNRLAFATQLRELASHLGRYKRPLYLIVLDLDHFKSINDRLGHLSGDSALKFVTGIIHEHLVSADLFGRFGGDEFLIASADHDPASALELAEAIRRAVASAAPYHAPALVGLTLSMGLASADAETGYSVDRLFSRADAALYEAKRQGRNRIVVADASLAGMPGDGISGRHL